MCWCSYFLAVGSQLDISGTSLRHVWGMPGMIAAKILYKLVSILIKLIEFYLGLSISLLIEVLTIINSSIGIDIDRSMKFEYQD